MSFSDSHGSGADATAEEEIVDQMGTAETEALSSMRQHAHMGQGHLHTECIRIIGETEIRE